MSRTGNLDALFVVLLDGPIVHGSLEKLEDGVDEALLPVSLRRRAGYGEDSSSVSEKVRQVSVSLPPSHSLV